MKSKQYNRLAVERKLIPIDRCPCCSSLHLQKVAYKKFSEYDVACQIGLLEDGDTLSYTFCQGCGFVFLNPRYSPETLSLYYQMICPANDDFWLPQDRAINLIYAKRQEERFNKLFRLLKRFAGNLNSIADIGGKDGASLVPFVQDGSEAFIIDPGCEPQALANKEMMGYKSVDEFLESGKKVSCIISLQTLEHVYEPALFLLSTLSGLNEHGILLLEVPYDLSFMKFLFTRNINPPNTVHAEHINFYSIHSLTQLICRLGLAPVKVFTGLQVAKYGGFIPSITIIAKKVHETSTELLSASSRKPVELKDLQREVCYQSFLLKLRRKYSQINCKLRGLEV